MDIDLLKRTLKYHGWTNEKLAKAMGIHRDTLQRRFRTGSFRIRDIQQMRETIPLTKQEVEEIFLNEK